MNICIFDTEATSGQFCYNIGYVIVDTDTRETLVSRDFVVEQVWHNLPLFMTAYYADKRPIYISAMRSRKTILDKFGYICQAMIRDFKNFDVKSAYAFNVAYDENIFNFNCDYYKCNNPFDNIALYDIRGYVFETLVNFSAYRNFCDVCKLYTDSGNYSTTAETVYKFISNNPEFVEDHTANSDSKIECEILYKCIDYGANYDTVYECNRKKTEKETVKTDIIKLNGEIIATIDYKKKINYKTKNTIAYKI